MRQTGLLHIASKTAGCAPFYELSDKGRFFAEMVNRHNPPELADILRERIASSRLARTMKQTGRLAERGMPETHKSILEALEHGPLATAPIMAAMRVPFKNPKSGRLALHTLLERGLVQKVYTAPKGQVVWSLVPATDSDVVGDSLA